MIDCPNYKHQNPIMIDFISAKSIVYGMCANEEGTLAKVVIGRLHLELE